MAIKIICDGPKEYSPVVIRLETKDDFDSFLARMEEIKNDTSCEVDDIIEGLLQAHIKT